MRQKQRDFMTRFFLTLFALTLAANALALPPSAITNPKAKALHAKAHLLASKIEDTIGDVVDGDFVELNATEDWSYLPAKDFSAILSFRFIIAYKPTAKRSSTMYCDFVVDADQSDATLEACYDSNTKKEI
jgi:hypothetical protein